MVDRSYLPFQSARYYKDAGMQKWFGFFLSEHTTSLEESYHTIDFTSQHSISEKYLLLSQAYVNQLHLQVTVREKKIKQVHLGIISDLSKQSIVLKTDQGHQLISLEDILALQVVEEA